LRRVKTLNELPDPERRSDQWKLAALFRRERARPIEATAAAAIAAVAAGCSRNLIDGLAGHDL